MVYTGDSNTGGGDGQQMYSGIAAVLHLRLPLYDKPKLACPPQIDEPWARARVHAHAHEHTHAHTHTLALAHAHAHAQKHTLTHTYACKYAHAHA